MNFRTYRFYGNGYATTDSAAVMVFFNGEQIYTGAVPTRPLEDLQQNIDPVILFQAGIDITQTGNLPLKIIVTKGTVKFTHIEANYSGCEIDLSGLASLPETMLMLPEHYQQRQFVKKPVDFWGDPDGPSGGDSRKNVRLDGFSHIRPDETVLGYWSYTINSGITFECDVYVNPNTIINIESPYQAYLTEAGPWPLIPLT
jgi:hypothetical protein